MNRLALCFAARSLYQSSQHEMGEVLKEKDGSIQKANHVAEEKIVQEKAATSSYPPSSCLHTDLSQTKERMVFSKVWQVAMDRTMYKITCLQLLLRTWYGIIGRRGLPNPGRSSTRIHIIVPCRAVPCWHG